MANLQKNVIRAAFFTALWGMAGLGLAQDADPSILAPARNLQTQCLEFVALIDSGGPATMKAGMCIGYVRGKRDMLGPRSAPTICMPDSVRSEELARVFLQWADKNAKSLALLNQGVALGIAFHDKYPCPR